MPTDKRSPSFVFYVAKTRTSDLVSQLIVYHFTANSTIESVKLVTTTCFSVSPDNAAVYGEP